MLKTLYSVYTFGIQGLFHRGLSFRDKQFRLNWNFNNKLIQRNRLRERKFFLLVSISLDRLTDRWNCSQCAIFERFHKRKKKNHFQKWQLQGVAIDEINFGFWVFIGRCMDAVLAHIMWMDYSFFLSTWHRIL